MNKLTLTRKGLECLQSDNQEDEQYLTITSNHLFKRSNSLPQLISSASLIQKQEVSDQLAKLTHRLKDIKEKGIRKIMAEREDG